MTAVELFNISPVVPVVVLERVADAVPLAEALLEGGVGVMEVTLRSDAALECIEAIAKVIPEMNVGAGTVITNSGTPATLAGMAFINTEEG
ncbi:MAG: hypothetical protein IE886_03105 [Campylobacterales bacterium]|nr:hypothetical protein [Campylobacterales bacterium]